MYFSFLGIRYGLIGFIKITEQGLRQAIFMALRLIYLVVGTSMLTLDNITYDITDGIERTSNHHLTK